MSNEVARSFQIDGKNVGLNFPTYFIADIAANHDGDIARARELIKLAAEAGADAAKFQHFKAETIVSKRGFIDLGEKVVSHQSKWKKSVVEVYDAASVNLEWTAELLEESRNSGISFFSTPYSIEIANDLDSFVPAYKIGSGDITWIELIEHVARKNKPLLIASGASSTDDVIRAIDAATSINPEVCLMQCNTNYTGSLENFKYLQLKVLKTYREMYPNHVLGLSDHTPGHSSVLGAIALGASVVEKHFTDDQSRPGPDHAFSMDPFSWTAMVENARELEFALGDGKKKIEKNEGSTVVVQRRAIRVTRDLVKGETLSRACLEVLRPCPPGSIQPFDIDLVVGKKLSRDIQEGEHLTWSDLS